MSSAPHQPRLPLRRRGRGVRPWLIGLKGLGLIGFLGGLASLTALTALAPEPQSLEGWQTLREAMRAIFIPCLFAGLILTLVAGVALFLQHPRQFARLRWFRLKALLLVVLIPSFHFWAHGRVEAFDAAVESGARDQIVERFDAVGNVFALALIAMLLVAALGKFKPRLGEAYGSREERVRERKGPSAGGD